MNDRLESIIKKILYLSVIGINIIAITYYYYTVVPILSSNRFINLTSQIYDLTIIKIVFVILPVILSIHLLIEIVVYLTFIIRKNDGTKLLGGLQRSCIAFGLIFVINSMFSIVLMGTSNRKEDPVVKVRNLLIYRFTTVQSASYQYREKHGEFPCDYNLIDDQVPFRWRNEMSDYTVPRAENCTTEGVLWIISPIAKEPYNSDDVDCKLGLGDQAEFSNLEGVMSCFNYVAERFSDGSVND
ncbi:MAG: hypothetical protein HC921_22400 [Synechococcaceae cyanobacterium SM2_3_1]|nr:hypothetical protein [Synechococcaceae cyanobacterium SM2_3_1]